MNPQLFYSIYFPEEINRGTISSVVDENSTNKSKSPLTENIVAAGLAGGAAILAAAVSSKTMAPAAAAKAFAGTWIVGVGLLSVDRINTPQMMRAIRDKADSTLSKQAGVLTGESSSQASLSFPLDKTTGTRGNVRDLAASNKDIQDRLSAKFPAKSVVESSDSSENFSLFSWILEHLPQSVLEGVVARLPVSETIVSNSYEFLFSQYNIKVALILFASVAIMFGMFILGVIYILRVFSSYFVIHFPKTLGRLIESKILIIAVYFNVFGIVINTIVILKASTFLFFSPISPHLGVFLDNII